MYAALATQAGLRGWWTADTSADEKVGGKAEFGFEWVGTELTFDLRQTDGATVLLFAQRGWKEQVEFMHYCSTKWGTYLLGLKASCEIGQGTPYPHDVEIG